MRETQTHACSDGTASGGVRHDTQLRSSTHNSSDTMTKRSEMRSRRVVTTEGNTRRHVG